MRHTPLVAVVGYRQETNASIVAAWKALGIRATLLEPDEALERLDPGDIAVGRFDVLRALDGVEAGIEVLDELTGRGVRVLNGVDALLNAHDKLRTARLLEEAGLPHPRTVTCRAVVPDPELPPPLVLKPRFGSWGVDVFRCETEQDVERTLAQVATRPWFLAHGALLQELVPTAGSDVRLVVAGGEVVGAAERVAARGEWRTNVSLGGTKRPVDPSPEACALAIRAATTVGADLVGVDLLPVGDGFVVLELNGAVEFDDVYDLPGSDAGVFEAAAHALGLLEPARGGARGAVQTSETA